MESNHKTLAGLKVGESGVIDSLHCENRDLRNKLLAMGVIGGVSVQVTRIAPLGDPIKVKLYGSQLALRLSEAAHVRLTDK